MERFQMDVTNTDVPGQENKCSFKLLDIEDLEAGLQMGISVRVDAAQARIVMDKAMPVSLLDPLRDSAGRRLFTDHVVETLREIFRHNAEHTRVPRKEESR